MTNMRSDSRSLPMGSSERRTPLEPGQPSVEARAKARSTISNTGLQCAGSITPTGGSFASFAAGPGPGQWTAVLDVPEGWRGPIDLAAAVDGIEASARLAQVVPRKPGAWER